MKFLNALCLLVTMFFSTALLAENYIYTGQVTEQDLTSQTIVIDYQNYQLLPQTLVIGASKRGEHGAVLITGQTVEFNTESAPEGPPIITEIRIINGDQ